MSVVPVGTDPVDGGPVWAAIPGTELVPGQLAWGPLGVREHGQTWLCWSTGLWLPTVVELVRPGWPGTAARALVREAAALRGVCHPAFPRLLADGTRSPLPHLVVEHLDGPTLDEALDEDGPLSGPDTARLGVGLLGALRALHATGRAHLDVCPEDVLLVDRRVRLVGLGAARPLGAALRPAEPAGRADFAAPELTSQRGRRVTAAMDVFGVGATLQAVLDPTDPDRGLRSVVGVLTDPDPDARPPVDVALGLLLRSAGESGTRPWPRWADPALTNRPTA